ncbi:hypothetical protein AB0D10_11125 [Kitasatospora sp. NPDC048545]|uniref:hypothetical protein n=1 Tax=Kitasatospora sp. NPDC048545 TaxID=3157208 RepID=UPI0034014929
MPSTAGSPCNNSSQVRTALASGVPGGDSAYLLDYSPGSFWQERRVAKNTTTGALAITNVATGPALDAPQTTTGSTVLTNHTNAEATEQSWTPPS